MEQVIGIQFQKNGKLFYFDANGIEAKVGDYVIVDTVRGYDLGEVAIGNTSIDIEKMDSALKKTIRLATEQDIQHSRENRVKEKEAFSICQEKISEHKLEMKLVSVEYAFDNSKILFFFTANGRVDFRSLVKDLASIFKMRIELRQIGVRDEAKMLGGLGPCGRPICCGSFLDQFQPVSIKMAKEQNLSLNPTKISGVCGRLMCCLKYEQEHYEMTRKKMPKVGKEVKTPDGIGTVTDLNIVKETVFVKLTNGDTSEIKEYQLEQIEKTAETIHPHEKVEKMNIHPDETEEQNKQEKFSDVYDDQDAVTNLQTPERDNRESAEAGRNKAKNKTRKNTLGQPVRRENRKRNENVQPIKDKASPEGNNSTETEPSSGIKKNAPQSSSWSDAVQKAMQAINEEN